MAERLELGTGRFGDEARRIRAIFEQVTALPDKVLPRLHGMTPVQVNRYYFKWGNVIKSKRFIIRPPQELRWFRLQ